MADNRAEQDFKVRLAKLRAKKGVSARDMSLSIGQNAGYINNIESGKALPSMSGFFAICEYFNILPKDFFEVDTEDPEEIQKLVSNLRGLDPQLLKNVSAIVEGLVDNHS